MTQDKRDWQKDMEIIQKMRMGFYHPDEILELSLHWLNQYASAEAREQRLKEAWQELREIVLTNATGGKGEDINDYDIIRNIMDDLLELPTGANLYPDTPAPKEESE